MTVYIEDLLLGNDVRIRFLDSSIERHPYPLDARSSIIRDNANPKGPKFTMAEKDLITAMWQS